MKRNVRRSLTLLLTGCLLALGPLPAAHAAGPVVVDGFDYPTALRRVADACPGGSAPAFSPLYGLGSVLGAGTTGHGFGGSTTGMAGIEVDVSSPRTLGSFTIQTYQDAPVNGDAPDGYASVAFDPSADDFGGDYFYASESLNNPLAGWAGWNGLADISYHWSYGNQANVFTGTVADIANWQGTNGSGAKVAFELGCDGRDYFMDDLEVTQNGATKVYDFEGAETKASITAATRYHGDVFKRDITRINLVYGQAHYLLGDSYAFSDGWLADGYVAGTAKLYRKSYGSSVFTWVASKAFEPDTYAHFRIEPSRQTYYQVRVPATSELQGDSSTVLLVTVKRRVAVSSPDTVIRKGQRMVLTGSIAPRDRGVTVTFQRYVSGSWHSIVSTRTGDRGRYSIGVRARTIGKLKVRVKVATAKGNIGTASRSITFTVKRVPPPIQESNPQPSAPYVPPVPDPDDVKARPVLGAETRTALPSGALGLSRVGDAWAPWSSVTEPDD